MRFGYRQSPRGGKGDGLFALLVLGGALSWVGLKIQAGAWAELAGTAVVLAVLFVLIMIASVYMRGSAA